MIYVRRRYIDSALQRISLVRDQAVATPAYARQHSGLAPPRRTNTVAYGRALGGQRMGQGIPLYGRLNVTLTASLTPIGLEAAMTVRGAVNGTVFAAYLDQVLSTTLRPGDMVVLDNLPAHKVDDLVALVEARGARLIYVPPYSPNCRPIPMKSWKKPFGPPLTGSMARMPVIDLPTMATSYTDLKFALGPCAGCSLIVFRRSKG